MVEPVEMELEVIRCLANVSDIDVSTNLKQITVHLGLRIVTLYESVNSAVI